MDEWERVIPQSRSKFIRVKCPDCGNEQPVFSHTTTVIYCKVCGAILAEPSGGKAQVKGDVIAIMD